MGKVLPVFKIKGTEFYVDVEHDRLLQVDNPDNVIMFYRLRDVGTHYVMMYDTHSKNLSMLNYGLIRDGWISDMNLNPKGSYDNHCSNVVHKKYEFNYPESFIKIPPLKILDPEGMSAKYNVRSKELFNKTDYEIIVDQDILRTRIKGKQVCIDILGNNYYVKTGIGLLEPQDLMLPWLDTLKMRNLEGNLLDFLYNTDKNCIEYYNSSNLDNIPENISFVEIPILEKLDPVGFCISNKRNLKTLTRQYPPQMNFIAKIGSVREDYLIPLIERNRQYLNERQVKKQSNKLRHKKGLHR